MMMAMVATRVVDQDCRFISTVMRSIPVITLQVKEEVGTIYWGYSPITVLKISRII